MEENAISEKRNIMDKTRDEAGVTLVNCDIKSYIESDIIPQYNSLDKAHNIEHANRVIENSLSIASDYDVDINMVYVVAAFHDLGLALHRKKHHIKSALILKEDKMLHKWFSQEQIDIMADACEDHRASNNCEPRSIYGKIVAEADRDIEYNIILKRCIQFGLEIHPEYNLDEHFDRVYEHIMAKYGESGFLKCWLDTDANRKGLSDLRNGLKNKSSFKEDFNRIFDSIKTE